MNKLSIGLLLISATGLAQAEDGFYMSLNAGMALPTFSKGTDSATEGQDLAVDYYALNDSNLGYVVGGALGYGINDLGRVEIEVSHQKNEQLAYFFNSNLAPNDDFVLNEGDVSTESIAVMFNGYIDFKNDSSFTPYVGIGLGYANLKLSGNRVDAGTWPEASTNTFAYQGMAGVDWQMTDTLSIGAKYTYFGTLGLIYDQGLDSEYNYTYSTNNFSVVAKVSF